MKAAILNQVNTPFEIENLIQEGPKFGEVKIKVNKYMTLDDTIKNLTKQLKFLPINHLV